MNLREWFHMQSELDQYIINEHGLQHKNLLDEKLLALLVEVSELANETRCFKFWSKKPPSESNIILEEFVDGVHFILSIGLDLGFSQSDIPLVVSSNNDNMTQSFLDIFHLIDQLRESHSFADYKELMQQYFALGQLLGFTVQDVQRAYKEKNEINYQRQQEGY